MVTEKHKLLEALVAREGSTEAETSEQLEEKVYKLIFHFQG